MHHQRVVQEKNKLISDIHRLKNKCSMFEPMIEGIQKKYENAMKEKMLTKLDRDRLAGKVSLLYFNFFFFFFLFFFFICLFICLFYSLK